MVFFPSARWFFLARWFFFGQVVCVLEDGLALRRSNDHRPQADLAGRLSSLNPWVGNYYFAAMEWSMQ